MTARPLVTNALIFLLLLSLAVVVYWTTLNDYFVSADFFQISYVWQRLADNPLSLLKNFSDTWAENRHHSLYYRPLMPLAFISDCLMWQGNAFGYHLSNVIMHAVCSWILFLLAKKLFQVCLPQRATETATFAAAIFAVHPIHTESVAWISGRVDFYCTALMYAAFYVFLRNRESSAHALAPLSPALYAGAQLFKEAAASLPPILTLYDFIFESQSNWRHKLVNSLNKTKWFWLILLTFLALRTVVLHTWLGGFVGTFGESRKQSLLYWLFESGSFTRLLFPFPIELHGIWNWFAAVFVALYIVTIIRAVLSLTQSKIADNLSRTGLFLLGWAVIALMPIIYAWYLTAALIGGHLAYGASGPLCLLLTLILFSGQSMAPVAKNSAPTESKTTGSLFDSIWFPRLILAAFLLCFALNTVLICRYWSAGAADSLKLKRQLEQIAKALPGDQKFLLLNSPRSAHGIYLFPYYISLSRCLVPPFCQSDLSAKLISVDHFMYGSPMINISHLKRLLADGVVPYKWEANKAQLVRCALNLNDAKISNLPQTCLTTRIKPEGDNLAQYAIKVDPDVPPLAVDCVDVLFVCGKEGSAEGAQEDESNNLHLTWGDNSVDKTDAIDYTMEPTGHRLDLPVIVDGKSHLYRFQVSQCKSWITAAAITNLKLGVSGDSYEGKTFKLLSVQLNNLKTQMPSLVPDVEAMQQRQDGSYSVKKTDGNVYLHYDTTMLPGAVKAVAEISKPDFWFEKPPLAFRDTEFSDQPLRRLETTAGKGNIILATAQFPSSAYYEVRIAALDKEGKIIGYFSDPVGIYIALEVK